MDIIRTGIKITQTIKNVNRLKEIISILARNGFDEFIISTNLNNLIPNFVIPKKTQERIHQEMQDFSGRPEDDKPKLVAYRLRKSFEEMGPSFIKIGQLLSTREDIFPQSFIEELCKLQDKVKGIPFEVAKAIIEKSLGKPVEQIFAKIDETPIGTASIGVVYKAQLLDGSEVVVKVKRPNIDEMIHTDFNILLYLIEKIEKVSDEIKYLGISKAVTDFSITLQSELDFQVEAVNCEKIGEKIKIVDTENIIYIPKMYKEYVKRDVLVMELIKGTPFTNREVINSKKAMIYEKLEKSVHIFIHNMLVDGFFHADLHGGNFFLTENNQIGIIDFGLMGNLGKASRASLVAILYSLVSQNYETLVFEFLEVAEYEKIPDVDELIRDVRNNLSGIMGLTVKQTNFSFLMSAVLRTLNKHRITLPREWFIVFRSLITLDGVGRSLEIDFDIFKIVDKDIRPIVKSFFSKEQMIETGIWLGRDFFTLLRTLPRHFRWFLKDVARNNYSFQVINKGYEKQLQHIGDGLYNLGQMIFSGVLFYAGFSMYEKYYWANETHNIHNIPVVIIIFWGLGLALFLKNILKR